jgi:hypothetical protein
MNKTKKIKISGCARCGEDHYDLEEKKFSHHPHLVAGRACEHFTMCPTLNEPILIAYIEEDEPPAPFLDENGVNNLLSEMEAQFKWGVGNNLPGYSLAMKNAIEYLKAEIKKNK